MATIPNALYLPRPHSIRPPQNRICGAKASHSVNLHVSRFNSFRLGRRSRWLLLVRVSGASPVSGDTRVSGDGNDMEVDANGVISDEKPASALRQVVGGALPPAILAMKKDIGLKLAIGLCFAFAFLALAAKQIMLRKNNSKRQGSVADLVRRGQLRFDRRGISNPMKYDDPFNNPLIKTRKSDSTVEVCGKVYLMAPVTLTKEQQSIHQRRRSRSYQWKRPTVFLKEGDPVPPDVDLDTIRWIPVNHPFATTVSDIDEDLAQKNVFQKHGVPFRVKLEHEAMQKKLEALQNEQNLSSSTNQKYGHEESLPGQELDFPDRQTSVDEGKEL